MFSQQYNVLSIEGGYGFNIPITPTAGINRYDYVFPRHLDFGVRYMLREYLGVKGSYSNDRFQNLNNKDVGIGYHRLSIEGVYNLNNALNMFGDNFNVFFHAGLGLTYAFPEAIQRFKKGGEFTFGLDVTNTKPYERIGNIVFGFTPQFRLSDVLALTVDLTRVMNLQQQYLYNGELFDIKSEKIRGQFFNFSVGIQYYLGRRRYHADWY